MELICDTNVWYDIGSGRIDAHYIKSQGHALLATAVNVLEIGSKLTDKSLPARRQAAAAILNHASRIVEDPERHLGTIWQTSLPPLKTDWKDIIKAVSQAPDMASFTNGIIDTVDRVIRSVDYNLATRWRDRVYSNFADDVIKVLDKESPGYAAARAQKKGLAMRQTQLTQFQAKMANPGMFAAAILATYQRVRLQVRDAAPQPTKCLQDAASQSLTNYARAYSAYLIHIAAGVAPEPNDWGDLEAFIYLHDGKKLLTSEKKWYTIAQRAGIERDVLNPKVFAQPTKSIESRRQE